MPRMYIFTSREHQLRLTGRSTATALRCCLLPYGLYFFAAAGENVSNQVKIFPHMSRMFAGLSSTCPSPQ